MVWSPDGKMLASGGYILNPIRLWDVATGKEVRRFNGNATVLAWSPDGKRALTQTESARESWPIFRPFRGMRLDSMASFPFKRVAEEA